MATSMGKGLKPLAFGIHYFQTNHGDIWRLMIHRMYIVDKESQLVASGLSLSSYTWDNPPVTVRGMIPRRKPMDFVLVHCFVFVENQGSSLGRSTDSMGILYQLCMI
jgi:hypothetical protein